MIPEKKIVAYWCINPDCIFIIFPAIKKIPRDIPEGPNNSIKPLSIFLYVTFKPNFNKKEAKNSFCNLSKNHFLFMKVYNLIKILL